MWLEQWIPSAILPLLGALGTPTVSITPFAPRSSLRAPPQVSPSSLRLLCGEETLMGFWTFPEG